MYCRICGSKISEQAKFCDACGSETAKVKQRPDAEKIQAIEAIKNEKKSKKETKFKDLKNPYVIPAITTAIIAFTLAAFPYPRAWGIGTSLWMKIIILVVALLSAYHSKKAKQVNNLYEIRYRYKVQPKMVKTATVLGTITVLADLFAIITMY